MSACLHFVVLCVSVSAQSMPHTSEKQQHMRRMHSHMGERVAARLFHTAVEDDDSVEDLKDCCIRIHDSCCRIPSLHVSQLN